MYYNCNGSTSSVFLDVSAIWRRMVSAVERVEPFDLEDHLKLQKKIRDISFWGKITRSQIPSFIC